MTMLRSSSPHAMGGIFLLDPSGSGSSAWTQKKDTLQCGHCGAHWDIDPGSGKNRGFCGNCSRVTCGGRRCVESCTPMEKQLEIWEAEYAARTDYSRILNEMAAARSEYDPAAERASL